MKAVMGTQRPSRIGFLIRQKLFAGQENADKEMGTEIYINICLFSTFQKNFSELSSLFVLSNSLKFREKKKKVRSLFHTKIGGAILFVLHQPTNQHHQCTNCNCFLRSHHKLIIFSTFRSPIQQMYGVGILTTRTALINKKQ